jgi:hypothetical protein
MRLVLIFSFLFLSKCIFAQNDNPFFCQAQFNSKDKNLISSIESEIRKNSGIKVIRIDPSSGQVFILTKDQENWTKQDFLSLFGQYAQKVSCLSIGIHGKDKTKEFPFLDCE